LLLFALCNAWVCRCGPRGVIKPCREVTVKQANPETEAYATQIYAFLDPFACTNIVFNIAITLFILHRNMYAIFAAVYQKIFLCLYVLHMPDSIQVVVRVR
jgi:hypothetical protein